jgi:hypothetical protein
MSYNSSFSDSGFGSSFDSVGFAVSTDFQACGPLGPLLKPVNVLAANVPARISLSDELWLLNTFHCQPSDVVFADFVASGKVGLHVKPVNIKRLVVYVLAGVDVTNIKCGIGSRPEDDAAL